MQVHVVCVCIAQVTHVWQNCGCIVPCDFLFLCDTVDFPCATQHDAFPQNRLVVIELESHEIEWSPFSLSGLFLCVIEPEHLPVSFHLQVELFSQESLNLLLHPVEFLFVLSEHHHIIHIPDIMHRFQLLFDEMVERLQHEI